MILSDRDLKTAIATNRLKFSPGLLEKQIGPASIDLRLCNIFREFRRGQLAMIDPKEGIPSGFLDTSTHDEENPFIIHPQAFVLAATEERITVPDDLCVRVEGKSTLARMGIIIHSAGFIDPGFEGSITLEISNNGVVPVKLYPGMFICQIAAQQLTSPAEVPYNRRPSSAYMNDSGPAPARTQNLFAPVGNGKHLP